MEDVIWEHRIGEHLAQVVTFGHPNYAVFKITKPEGHSYYQSEFDLSYQAFTGPAPIDTAMWYFKAQRIIASLP